MRIDFTKLRKLCNMTILEISSELGVSPYTYIRWQRWSKYGNNASEPNQDNLNNIIKFMHAMNINSQEVV